MSKTKPPESKISPENLIALAALIISIVAIIVPTRLAINANKTAKEALHQANMANDIASGRIRILPRIKIVSYPKNVVNLTSLSNIQNSDLNILLFNTGEVPIDYISFEIIGVSGLWLSHKSPVYDYSVLGLLKKGIELDSQLESGGYVSIDLKKPILEFIQKTTLPNKNDTFHIILNLVFLPRRVGEDKPIQTPGNSENDRQLIAIEFIPEILVTDEISKILSNNEIPQTIWNYPVTTDTP